MSIQVYIGYVLCVWKSVASGILIVWEIEPLIHTLLTQGSVCLSYEYHYKYVYMYVLSIQYTVVHKLLVLLEHYM